MQTTLKVLSLLGKILGAFVAMDQTLVSPKYGVIIFFAASVLKDVVNRVGDFLDDGKENHSFNALVIGALLLGVSCTGCAHFITKQTDTSYDDQGHPQRAITTTAKATTFFDAGSQLANFKANQTDKSQGATVGSLNQASSGTNTVDLVGTAVGAAVSAAVKSVKP